MRLVPVSYLREGTEIAIDVINEDGRILFKKGQKVTQGGIACLDRLGVSYVYITDEHCFNDKEVRYGSDFNTIYRSILKLRRIAYRVAEGTSDKTDIIAGLTVARTIVEYIVAMDDDVKITYEPSKMVVNSVIERAIYVAMMSTVLGHKMKLSKDRLVKLCLSGLLKDLALVSPKIKNIKTDIYPIHPMLAYQYLKEHYDIDQEILDAVLHHHELSDGSGFPNQLKGEEICEFARIIGIIDMFYEIKSSHDMIHDTQDMFETKLINMLNVHDMKTLSYFIKETELFMPDTLVRLSNDDVAVIVRNNFTNIFRPVVKIIHSNTFLTGEIVELQEYSKLKIKNIEYYA